MVVAHAAAAAAAAEVVVGEVVVRDDNSVVLLGSSDMAVVHEARKHEVPVQETDRTSFNAKVSLRLQKSEKLIQTQGNLKLRQCYSTTSTTKEFVILTDI